MRQPSVLKPLTRQQRRVAALVATEGLQNKEIAYRLHLTPATVAQYMYAIFKRTGCQSRTELALVMWRAGKMPQVAA